MVAKRTFGTLYVNGWPVVPGSRWTEVVESIDLKSTEPRNAISWVMVNGLLVADHTILLGVSWDNLYDNGMIFGKDVLVDRLPYRVRSLKIGGYKDAPCEWHDFLNEVGEDDDLWHWKEAFFWGQEMDEMREDIRQKTWSAEDREIIKPYRVYGGEELGPRFWNSYCSFYRDKSIGFRPVLEPISPVINDALVDSKLMIWSNTGSAICGYLKEFTSYDLVLDDCIQLAQGVGGESNFAKSGHGRQIFIDRKEVFSVQAYQE